MSNINLPRALSQAIDQLNRLPGIGRKTATRLAFHLLDVNKEDAEALALSILKLKDEIKFCRVCFNFSESDVCPICSDPKRSHKNICVVEDAAIILMIEKTNEYKGVYHVLGGVISPLDGVGPENLHIRELVNRLEGVEEIILALNPSTEGEATSIYLSHLLKPMNIKITRLARGIPLGSTLEFVDELTLGRALKTRREL